MDRNVARNTPRPRPVFGLAVLLAGAMLAGTLSQCRLVSDPTSGLEVGPGTVNARTDCVHECNERLKRAKRAEDELHKQLKRACGSDKACKKAEESRHKAAKKTIDNQKKLCKKGCYNEGAGAGGR